MSESEIEKYGRQAAMYDQLACYYKYTNPQKYMYTYVKYYEAISKLVHAYEQSRISPTPLSEAVQPSYLRILHASPNIPLVDIIINGKKMVKNISFKQYSPYFSLSQGQYRLDIVPAGEDQPIFSTLVPVMGNHSYTLATTGNDKKIQILPLTDSAPLPSGKAKLRFVHLSPDATAVDVFLKDGDSLFEKVSFLEATDYVQVSPGIASMEIYPAGLKNTILIIPETEITENKLYTIALIGYRNKSPKLETMLLTN